MALVLSCLAGCSASRSGGADPLFREITIAAVSHESRIRDVEGNLARIEAWSREGAAAGADLVLFPETAISGWWASREIRGYAEPLDGPSIRRLTALARELGVLLVVGMTERDGDGVYITQVILDGSGVVGAHRKSELSPGEEKHWDEGDDARVFEIRGLHVGIAICYESVHPETCAKLRANGAEIILAPHANGTDPEELATHRRKYPFERAKENGVWYVACDSTPHDENGGLRPGAAYVINPEGDLAALTAATARGENMLLYTIRLPRADGK